MQYSAAKYRNRSKNKNERFQSSPGQTVLCYSYLTATHKKLRANFILRHNEVILLNGRPVRVT